MSDTELRVWVAQCVCPQGHAILAAAGEAEGESAAEQDVAAPLRSQVAELLRTEVINPWCGLCKSPVDSWRYKLGRTRFRSMQEAEPALRQSEREQATTREAFGG